MIYAHHSLRSVSDSVRPMSQPKLAYISFDTVPAPKGAAIHISYFVQALAESFGTIDLITVAPHDKLKQHQLYLSPPDG